MTEPDVLVEVTATFMERLASIESFLHETEFGPGYDQLLDELRCTVIPNLRRFPRIGRRYLERPPESVEGLTRLSSLQGSEGDRLREYLHGDYLILYAVSTTGRLIHLLSIRHHLELSFQPSRS